MFLRQTPDDLAQKNEARIRELEISLASLQASIAAGFKELNLTPDEVDDFFKNRDNFSEEEWTELTRVNEELKHRFSEKCVLSDPKKVVDARASLPRNGQWLFVR